MAARLVLQTKKSKRKRKSEGEFDPERYTGKHTLKSRISDIGYFFRLQGQECLTVLKKAKRIGHDIKEDILSRLRR